MQWDWRRLHSSKAHQQNCCSTAFWRLLIYDAIHKI